jgi:hypothetical protein
MGCPYVSPITLRRCRLPDHHPNEFHDCNFTSEEEAITMSDKTTTTNGDSKRTRGPNKPKTVTPLEAAQYVWQAGAAWDAESWSQYNRVLDALRGPA